MMQGVPLDAKNEAAVAAGMAAAKTSSAATCVRVIGPSWAARTNSRAARTLKQRAYFLVKWLIYAARRISSASAR